MFKLLHFPGFNGMVCGICLFLLIGLLVWLMTMPKGKMGLRKRLLSNESFEFDFRNEKGIEKGSFVPLLTIYLDIAKVVSGLASGSIALLVGAATFRSTGAAGHLLTSFASPLFLLALSILWGVLFMALIVRTSGSRKKAANPTGK